MKLESLKVVHSSYKNAPAEVREKFALSESQAHSYLLKLKDMGLVSEAIAISTCNRTEVYFIPEKEGDVSQAVVSLLLMEKGLLDISFYSQYFDFIEDHAGALNRIFAVSTGLESQVLGDLQIMGQVKDAYQIAANANLAGPFLHRLMHTIFFTNKRIVQETSFRDGAASVSYAAVEQTETVTEHLLDPSILVLGVGTMGADVCRTLKDKGFSNLTILNRTVAKAEELAKELEVKSGGLDKLEETLVTADVVISSVNGELPLLTKQLLQNVGIQTHKYFIDLSMPRSVEPEVEEIPGVILYNIDHIQNKTSEALEARRNAIPRVQCLIAQSLVEFMDWSKEMAFSPTVQKLKNSLEQIRQEELGRYLKQLSEKEAELLDTVTKNIMQKIIKYPVLQLKAACKRGEAETLIDVIHELFDLEKDAKPTLHK